MQHHVKRHDDDTARAIAAYTGTVTQCEPGPARAPARTRSDNPADQLPPLSLAEIRLLDSLRAAND